MGVMRRDRFAFSRLFPLVLVGCAAAAVAQAPNPSSAANPYWGSVTAEPVSGTPLKLSLDDSVRRGLAYNLGLKEAENSEKALHGEKNVVEQAFLPNITLGADTGYYMHDLAALGFGPKTIKEFAGIFPGGTIAIRN